MDMPLGTRKWKCKWRDKGEIDYNHLQRNQRGILITIINNESLQLSRTHAT